MGIKELMFVTLFKISRVHLLAVLTHISRISNPMGHSEGMVSVALHIYQRSKDILVLCQYIVLISNPLVMRSKDSTLVGDQSPMVCYYPCFLDHVLIPSNVTLPD